MTDAYLGAAPAEVVLLVGIFGNFSDGDLARTIVLRAGAVPAGGDPALVEGTGRGDLNDMVRTRLAAAGFSELDYATLDTGTWPAVGVVRYDGPPVPLPTGQQLFTFRR